ncbi:MAG: hypothetical protein SOR61_05955 [Evtepia sp.]|uniref:hypothetical protein n=1 Tax=Evtepia sp. TaxID=2773933 RepID=UPI002A7655E6|nr:hypothetical protein [Evtepia sp.]MDY3014717.1 hypothetical protein [Evtepia sp.]
MTKQARTGKNHPRLLFCIKSTLKYEKNQTIIGNQVMGISFPSLFCLFIYFPERQAISMLFGKAENKTHQSIKRITLSLRFFLWNFPLKHFELNKKPCDTRSRNASGVFVPAEFVGLRDPPSSSDFLVLSEKGLEVT